MRDIRYFWRDGLNSVGMSSEVELPQFRVLGHRQRATEINLTTGTHYTNQNQNQINSLADGLGDVTRSVFWPTHTHTHTQPPTLYTHPHIHTNTKKIIYELIVYFFRVYMFWVFWRTKISNYLLFLYLWFTFYVLTFNIIEGKQPNKQKIYRN